MRGRGTFGVSVLLIAVVSHAAACTAQSDSRADSAQRNADSAATSSPVAASTPWDAARLRGADFRAIGQEPGWTLDVHEGEKLLYAGDYGRDTVRSPLTTVVFNAAGDVAYAVRVGTREIAVTIRNEACQDAMSGEAFTHTVVLRIDGQELNGCGRRP